MMKTHNAIKINVADNVAVALAGIKKGENVFGVTATSNILPGHKIALIDIESGQNVIKFGNPIGIATTLISQGEFVHTHNIKTGLEGLEEYVYSPSPQVTKHLSKSNVTFMGYERKNGLVGIRNEIWIINTVGCVNKIAERLAEIACKKYSGNKNIDGIYTFVHPYGCSQMGDDHVLTQKILRGMVNHPNAAGVLVLGLGCENNLIKDFKEFIGECDDDRVKFFNTQDVSDEISEGLRILDGLAEYVSGFRRTPIPIGKLVLGLKCGGSDGFSGVTANPLVGRLSGKLISHGGACLLTEVPEMFGAETLLMNRAVDADVFHKITELVNNFKQYYIDNNQVVYENPSPGNKEGGISTLEEKSLGCTQKGGDSPIVDVLDYGEQVTKPGLSLLQGPGNDMVAVTNLVAAGAHIVLFTTGRGTPLGGAVPTIKISSNQKLARTKPHWIDFDAGVLLEGKCIEELSEELKQLILEVASGKRTNNEENGYREIAIFKNGVTL